MEIAIIGGGAAGCFCAVNIKKNMPEYNVSVHEGSTKTLAKVALTGGGRCNLTNSFGNIERLHEAYPRGERLMDRGLRRFSHVDTMTWFEKAGVRLTTQEDCCVFPVSQDAMQIVRTLQNMMRRSGVEVYTEHRVASIEKGEKFCITFTTGEQIFADKVVVTTGGSPKIGGLSFLAQLGLEIISPVPSLFTFNVHDSVTGLMGTVVEASICIPGTKFRSQGPLLITDWGFSGPATLKLSSYAARYLAKKEYKAPILVNWLADSSETQVRDLLGFLADGQKMIVNTHPDSISSRLWAHIISKAGLREDIRWTELGSKGLNRLVNTIINCPYEIEGRGRFKEEFVTCGGVALSNININTMEAKKHPGLYFCGEVLDIDAVTGGFNLQAAWTTGYIAAESIGGTY